MKIDPKKSLYFYRANVVSVYDGDTITADIDLGMKIWLRGEKLRLFRINTPELTGEERPRGLESRDFLRKILPVGTEILISTFRDKRGKFGRFLAEIWAPKNDGFFNVNDFLVEKNFAEYKKY